VQEDFPIFRAGALLLLVAAIVVGGATLLGNALDGDGGDGGGDDPPKALAEIPEDKEDAGDGEGAGAAAMAGGLCQLAGRPVSLPGDVREASGAAASRRTAGVFWTHNDSGDPELFAVDSSGRLVGRVRVGGGVVEDWEDVAAGPCTGGGGNCLYVADIGDNRAARGSVTVYRFPEPAPGDSVSAPAEALAARYPDGAHDAEAIFVLPGDSASPAGVYVLTKGETGPVALYRLPATARPGTTATLERVRALAADPAKRRERITGAAASADGRWVAVRTLNELRIYDARRLVGAGAAPAPRIVDLRPLDEPQGEGVSFTPDGGVVLTSEGGGKNRPGMLTRLACTLEPEA
jgi:hypothetical protein